MTAGGHWDGDFDNPSFDDAAFPNSAFNEAAFDDAAFDDAVLLDAGFDDAGFDADDGQEPSTAPAWPDLGWHAAGFGHDPAPGTPEVEQGAQPVAGEHRLAEQFGQALETFVVDSGSLRSRILTGTAAAQRDLAAGKRPPDAARRRPRGRPHSARRDASRPGGPPAPGPHRARRARPGLVAASALAAVAGVIGVSAGLAGAFDGASSISGVAMTTAASPTSPTEPPVAPQPFAAAVDQTPTATPSPAQSQPVATLSTAVSVLSDPGSQRSTTGTSGRGGRTPWDGGDAPRAVSGWTVAPVRSGSQLILPQKGTVDWVVFGEGHGGVAARAAVPFQSIDVSGIAGAGSAQSGYPTSVSWSWGTPRSSASHYTTRLRIPGGRPVSLASVRGPHAGKLILVVGSVSSLRVNVSANGMQSAGFTVRLPSSTAVVTVDLSNLPYWTPATISLAGDHGSSFSLAAAVLD